MVMFRTGDRVRLISKPTYRGNDLHLSYKAGDEGTVITHRDDEGVMVVRFDQSDVPGDNGRWAIDEANVELPEPSEAEMAEVYRILGVERE